MKKSTARIALILACVLLAATLCACGTKLSGTYESAKILGVSSSYTFDGDKVTMSVAGIKTEGTYKIDGDKMTLTFLGTDTEVSFEKSGKTITIDGKEFTKK